MADRTDNKQACGFHNPRLAGQDVSCRFSKRLLKGDPGQFKTHSAA